jgi:hypothetical protein
MSIKEKENQVIVIDNKIMHLLKLQIQIHYYFIKMAIISYIQIYING